MDPSTRDVTVQVHGVDTTIHVPTIGEVTKEEQRLELSAKDLETWLIRASRFKGIWTTAYGDRSEGVVCIFMHLMYC